MWCSWSYLGILIILVVTLLPTTPKVSADLLPTIVLNSYNPIFACDDPVIKLQLEDQLNFACSIAMVHRFPLAGNKATQKVYENLYFLGTDKQAYDSCNATNAKVEILKCDPDNSTLRSLYNLIFRQHSTGAGEVFEAGKAYYFIGTGYKTKSMLDNLVNGSCNHNENGRFKIRLKVYVCTREEIANGTCQQCTTDACYYKDCGKNCSTWSTVSESIDDGTLFQSRSCYDTFLNENTREYQTIPSQPVNCSQWTQELIKQEGSNCTYLKKRTCINSLNEQVVQLQEVQHNCQTRAPPPNLVTGAPVTGGSDNDGTYTGIAIGASIFCLCVGIILGAFCYKGHHHKTCPSNTSIQGKPVTYGNGLNNDGYMRNSEHLDEYDGVTLQTKLELELTS